jgi:hypothetical protein
MNPSSTASASTTGNSRINNKANSDNLTVNSLAYIAPTSQNSYRYLLFDMHLVSSYTNSQITYYYITSIIHAVKQVQFQQLLQ